MTEYNPAPSPPGHPLLSGPPTLNVPALVYAPGAEPREVCERAPAALLSSARAAQHSDFVMASGSSKPPLLFCVCLLGCNLVASHESSEHVYESYVAAQRKKTDKLAMNGTADAQWVSKDQIVVIAKHLRSLNVAQNNFALCHGTRSGRENLWFRQAWSPSPMQVWGTDISPVAASTAAWTMPWDYHSARPEWIGQADFVYSNALDHSFNATLALSQWMAQTHALGAVVVQWSDIHTHSHTRDDVDRFGASEAGLVTLVCGLQTTMGPLHLHKLSLPPAVGFQRSRNIKHYALVVQRAAAASQRPTATAGLCRKTAA